MEHVFRCLEVVPCGGHVGATSTPSSTGSGTCKRFSSGPSATWQRMGPAKNVVANMASDVACVVILRGICTARDVGCHVIKLLDNMRVQSVFIMMSRATHVCSH